ncbi:DUF3726 domain-containing protein [Roseibium sediminis]|uniref:DUF3726 domain-containing protein n=1 Tax=Roseibium sediminis TaxID=1775174 RepID=UPI00123DE3FE|nr:DUF3726 domain-containing protein [Roseibium sediminis]
MKPQDLADGLQSFPPDGALAIVLSRNEIASLCFKAARGAGMSWGLAEEAGQAAAWLSARGLPGAQELAAHLGFAEGLPWQDVCPQVSLDKWRSASGQAMCPIAFGTTVCDYAPLPERPLSGDGICSGPISHPLLVLPFLSTAAVTLKSSIRLVWTAGEVVLTGSGGITGNALQLVGITAEEFVIHETMTANGKPVQGTMAPLKQDTVDILNRFALRTTVPPSDISRAGAGAGTSDND